MEKKVTREEVELVLNKGFGTSYIETKQRILNELFPLSEEEARDLEDDSIVFNIGENWCYIDGSKGIEAFEGHYFKTNEDGTEVTLHKRESC